MGHRFHFFRAGGVDQVSLRDGDDMLALSELDQKLWVALAMPTKGIDIEPETLTLFDADGDGRVRVQDVLAGVSWAKSTFKAPGDLLKSKDEVELSAISDGKIVTAAKRMLSDLGKADAKSIAIADTTAITKAFAETVLNGDGIVIAASAGEDAELVHVIDDIIACAGPVTDRSGKPGVDPEMHDAFFAAVDAPFVGDGFTRWVDGQYALGTPELGLSNWESGRLFARGGVLSGDGVFTVRTVVTQSRPDVHR